MTDKDTNSKTPVELKEAELDKVAGGLFSMMGAGTEVKVKKAGAPKAGSTAGSNPDGFSSTGSGTPTV